MKLKNKNYKKALQTFLKLQTTLIIPKRTQISTELRTHLLIIKLVLFGFKMSLIN